MTTVSVPTASQQAAAAALLGQPERWSQGRSKETGERFWLIQGSKGTAHYATAAGCTCRGFFYRGTCSHQLAVKVREDRERAARQTSDRYPVRPTDPFHYCACSTLIGRSQRRCADCSARLRRVGEELGI